MRTLFENVTMVVGFVAGGLTIAGKLGYLAVPPFSVGAFSLTQGFNSDAAFAVGGLGLITGIILWRKK